MKHFNQKNNWGEIQALVNFSGTWETVLKIKAVFSFACSSHDLIWPSPTKYTRVSISVRASYRAKLTAAYYRIRHRDVFLPL